jgi:hypothetical protein
METLEEGVVPTESEMLAFLTQDVNFSSCTTVRERCYWACQLLTRRSDGKEIVPFAAIGRILGEDRGHIKRNWERFKKQGNSNRPRGRHCILECNEHEFIVNEILAGFNMRRPMTVHMACNLIHERFGKEILPDTMYHIMARDARIRTCQAKPMEDSRLQVTDEDILQYFHELYSKVNGIPAHFVANMDEMGHQPFADAKDTICFVPSTFLESFVPYPVSRVGKRITLIGSIFADGSYLKPGLVIPRQTYDDQIICIGYDRNKVEIYTQKKGYIDRAIFEDWARDVLAPEIQKRREQYNYSGPFILILDNCSAHNGAAFENICTENNIKCIWLPPHSSHLLQMLDLCIFGVTKRFLNRLNNQQTKYIQAHHIVKVLDSFHSACCSGNISSSFSMGGISVFLDDEGTTRCRISPQRARRVLNVFIDPELRREAIEQLSDEEDEGYVPEEEPEHQNVRAVIQEIRAIFES